MGLFNFKKSASPKKSKTKNAKKSSSKKSKKKSTKKRKSKNYIKNLRIAPVVEDSLIETLKLDIEDPNQPFIGSIEAGDSNIVMLIALNNDLIGEDQLDTNLGDLKIATKLSNSDGDVAGSLYNASFEDDLSSKQNPQLVFLPTVNTLKTLDTILPPNAKVGIVTLPADLNMTNLDDYLDDGQINAALAPLEDDAEGDMEIVTLDGFRELVSEYLANDDSKDVANDELNPDLDAPVKNNTNNNTIESPTEDSDDTPSLDATEPSELPSLDDNLPSLDNDLPSLDNDLPSLDNNSNNKLDDNLPSLDETPPTNVASDKQDLPSIEDDTSNNNTNNSDNKSDDNLDDLPDLDNDLPSLDDDLSTDNLPSLDETDNTDNLPELDEVSNTDNADTATDSDDLDDLPGLDDLDNELMSDAPDLDANESTDKDVQSDTSNDDVNNAPAESDDNLDDLNDIELDDDLLNDDSDDNDANLTSDDTEAVESEPTKEIQPEIEPEDNTDTSNIPTLNDTITTNEDQLNNPETDTINLNQTQETPNQKQAQQTIAEDYEAQIDNILSVIKTPQFSITKDDLKYEDVARKKQVYNDNLRVETDQLKASLKVKMMNQIDDNLRPLIDPNQFKTIFPKLESMLHDKFLNEDDLDKIIAKINEEIEQRYLQTYEAMRQEAIRQVDKTWEEQYLPSKDNEKIEAQNRIKQSAQDTYYKAIDNFLTAERRKLRPLIDKQVSQILESNQNDIANATRTLQQSVSQYSTDVLTSIKMQQFANRPIEITQANSTKLESELNSLRNEISRLKQNQVQPISPVQSLKDDLTKQPDLDSQLNNDIPIQTNEEQLNDPETQTINETVNNPTPDSDILDITNDSPVLDATNEKPVPEPAKSLDDSDVLDFG